MKLAPSVPLLSIPSAASCASLLFSDLREPSPFLLLFVFAANNLVVPQVAVAQVVLASYHAHQLHFLLLPLCQLFPPALAKALPPQGFHLEDALALSCKFSCIASSSRSIANSPLRRPLRVILHPRRNDIWWEGSKTTFNAKPISINILTGPIFKLHLVHVPSSKAWSTVLKICALLR